MRRGLIGANWKMNGSHDFVLDFLRDFRDANVTTNVDLFVCPPLGYLSEMHSMTEVLNIQCALGAQDVSEESGGARTGEHSALMVRDLGAQYVLVGHSERRQYHAETDELVAGKFARVRRANMTPVLCIGETLDDRNEGRARDVVRTQLDAVLNDQGIKAFKNAVVAYEPVWAIGTGETATPEQAQTMHEVIRAQVSDQDSEIADALRILYGGSIKADNAEALFAQPDIDGGLVGGASLDVAELTAIIQAMAAQAPVPKHNGA